MSQYTLCVYNKNMNNESFIPGDADVNPDEKKDVKKVLEDFEHVLKDDEPTTDVEREIFVHHVMETLRGMDGEYHENVTDIYNKIKERVLIRREHPKNVFKSLLEDKDIPLFFNESFDSEEEGDTSYYNATQWDGAGDDSLKNPFVEGHSHFGNVVTMIGFDKGDDIVEHKIEGPHNPTEDGIHYDKNVSLSGNIHPDDIKFLITRIPTRTLKEEDLTEKELERMEEGEVTHVFRGVYFDNKKEEVSHETSS